jgi:tetratricopeptide (TPR) repeat protein
VRILRITGRQLVRWEKAGLFPVAESYSFFDLLQLKKLRDLRAKKVRPAVIRESLAAMQKQVAGMENPLLEAGTFSARSRVVFRHRGHAVEPVAGQYIMDFEPPRLLSAKVRTMRSPETAAELFAKGVALEEDPGTQLEAIQMYMATLELDPQYAAAYINLGTIYYNRRDYHKAEQYYRNAVEVDPRYALAYFDLGNVLDETGRLSDAVQTYQSALALAPTYADAHYNLALAFEKLHQPRKALEHWRAYLRLDQSGPWAVHARHQVQKILAGDPLRVVARKR